MDTNTKEQGLLRKYIITRADGGQLDPAFEAFVLRLDNGGDPKHVEACRKAIMAYAMAIQSHLPTLALDIFNRWGPEQPKGWKHHYFKAGQGATTFLVDKAVTDICNGKRVWFLTCNDREVRDVEIAIRAKLAEKFDRDDLGLAIHHQLTVSPTNSRTTRMTVNSTVRNTDTILIDNPCRSEFSRREGDPRKMLNKTLFMADLENQLELVSVENVSW
jgi:hypothetical protein